MTTQTQSIQAADAFPSQALIFQNVLHHFRCELDVAVDTDTIECIEDEFNSVIYTMIDNPLLSGLIDQYRDDIKHIDNLLNSKYLNI